MSDTLYSDIRAALANQLKDTTGIIAIAWENTKYTPVTGTPYLVPTLMMAEPSQATLGTDGLNQEMGIYQITIMNYPVDKGVGAQLGMAGKLKTRFKRGTILTYNDVQVRIRKAYLSGNNIVTVAFYSQVPN